MQEDSFGYDNLDNSLKDTKFTVAIYKHEVSGAEDRNKKINWQEAVAPVKDVKSGLYYQDAVKLSRSLEKNLSRDNKKFDHGWVDYFTHIKKDDFNESGGTVGFMFHGGYNAGMKSGVSKHPRKTKSFSAVGSKTDPDRSQKPQKVHKVSKVALGGRINQKKHRVAEKYNTNSTFIKVGKNLVELIKNKVTRRIRKGGNITENDIISHKVFVDGPEVGYIDEINDRFYVKDDDGLHTSYNTIEEALSIVMGQTYYDGKGTSEFIQHDFGVSYYNNAI